MIRNTKKKAARRELIKKERSISYKYNKSHHPGVIWNEDLLKWIVSIEKKNGEMEYLGSFYKHEELIAHKAYAAGIKCFHGMINKNELRPWRKTQ